MDPALRVTYNPALPITASKDAIIELIQNHQVVVIAGETGSGKTTQLPKLCLDAGLGRKGKIGCTQPRRVAALSISRRVAEELNVAWGKEVGCKIRFSDQSSHQTRIKFMTDGILLAEVQSDPFLREYQTIIIDEAHERSLNIDFLLGYLKGLLKKRPDLKLIITSATIDTKTFSEAFGNAPVIEVSGRVFPVEVHYAECNEEDDDYVLAAVRQTEFILKEEPSPGGILIFMPTERDIRETCERLQNSRQFPPSRVEIVPLFGRLSAGDQQRVFASTPLHVTKIVVATNIAETSLTIPDIRYVIDTGYARVSRYSPRTRTKRLPIEMISQSSARQRQGRCGRVANGVCIRLYSEENFNNRPAYTQPEIQRANLAEVILKLKAFQLGEVETFPFLNPPSPKAIQAGYTLLEELGALHNQSLTSLGKTLARLPIDPTLGRMLLQSKHEKAAADLLVIAAGLSISDPRERPQEKKEAADAAHRTFANPRSDFLSYLSIWEAAFPHAQEVSWNQLRRFCKTHFLSFIRMREWREVYNQLRDIVKNAGFHLEETHPDADQRYAAIHRSILSGTLGYIGLRTERNFYKGAGNRELMLFPGSGLFQRREEPSAKSKTTEKKPRQPQWIVAGEMVETQRLFARMVAAIEPEWILDLGAHLCRRVYSDPRWSPESQRVLVRERVLVHGLEVLSHNIGYGKIQPKDATEIFIREALIPVDAIPITHHFQKQNHQLRQKLEALQTRMRRQELCDLDDAFAAFYLRNFPQPVSSIPELNRLVHQHIKENPAFLCAKEADLLADLPKDVLDYDKQAFPDAIEFGNTKVPLQYAYAPGESQDGVTLFLNAPLAKAVAIGQLEWAVPGLREAQVETILKALPKSIRKQLLPLPPKIKEITAELIPKDDPLPIAIAKFIEAHYHVSTHEVQWPEDVLPSHLRPRIVVTTSDKTLAESRSLTTIRQQLHEKQLANQEPATATQAWVSATKTWEQSALKTWSFKDLPECIVVTENAGLPIHAYPGLKLDQNVVHIRLFPHAEEAKCESQIGFRFLVEQLLQKDLAWLKKELRGLAKTNTDYITLGTPEELQSSAYQNILDGLLPPEILFPLKRSQFQKVVHQTQTQLTTGLSTKFIDLISTILSLRHHLLLQPTRYPGMEEDIENLIPKAFLKTTPYVILPHLPRYLKAIQLRADRCKTNPQKDSEKVALVLPFQQKLKQFQAAKSDPAKLETFRWMLEEYKVSIFAQELKTAYPISAQRLKKAAQELE